MSAIGPNFIFNFIINQLFRSLPNPSPSTDHSFNSRTIIVTGANGGLGLEAARHFTELGAARVILAVRNLDKGNAAKASVEESTGTKGQGIVEVWKLDLSSYDSVKQFATKASQLDRLDVLVENAGIAVEKYAALQDNESTITVNVISTFLLALLLLPKLRETAAKYPHADERQGTSGQTKPHLVIVSSEAHFATSFPEQNAPEGKILTTLNDKSTADMLERYQVSKLLQVFFTRVLASRSSSSSSFGSKNAGGEEADNDVIINFLTPGLCESELANNYGWGFWLMKLARTAEQGSRTLVHASHAGDISHGQYMANCQVTPVAPMVQQDTANRLDSGLGGLHQRVWREITAKLQAIQPGIMQCIRS